MTDAERIAEYMLKREAMQEPFTAADVTRLATNNPGGQCGMLIAMLSDVRREEREATEERCVAILKGELDALRTGLETAMCEVATLRKTRLGELIAARRLADSDACDIHAGCTK